MSHFVDAKFGGAAEAVFLAAEDAIEVVSVTLKLEDGVDNMFQHLGAGYGTVLRNVPHQDDGRGTLLGIFQQGRGAFADLCDAACRTLHTIRAERLDGVHDEQFGLDAFHLVEDALQGGLAV